MRFSASSGQRRRQDDHHQYALHPAATDEWQRRVNGFDVVRQRSDVRRSIGLVFQQSTLDDALSAEQTCASTRSPTACPPRFRELRIRELLTLVELWDRRKGSVRTFSGGMKRRLEIARGLLHRPRVLFLDEPTLGLDPQTRRRIWDYLAELRACERLTVFLTTHYMDEAEHCDRLAVIDHGEIVALDTPDHLKSAVGGDLISISAADGQASAEELRQRFSVTPTIADATGMVSFRVPAGEAFLPEFVRQLRPAAGGDQRAPTNTRRRVPAPDRARDPRRRARFEWRDPGAPERRQETSMSEMYRGAWVVAFVRCCASSVTGRGCSPA